MSKRRSIKLLDHERQFLVSGYQKRRVPIDQFEARPEELEALCAEWRKHCKRTETNQEILHYMRTQRKRGKWVTLDGAHKPVPSLPELSPENKEILIAIYGEVVAGAGDGSDNIAYDSKIGELIAARFAEATYIIVPAHHLIAILTKIRKRGLLPPATQLPEKPEGAGFDDIDNVGPNDLDEEVG